MSPPPMKAKRPSQSRPKTQRCKGKSIAYPNMDTCIRRSRMLTGIIRQTGDDYSLELTSPQGQTLGIKPVSRRLPANILAKYVGQTVAVRGYPTLKQLGVVKGIQCIWIGEIKPDAIANRVSIAGVVGPEQKQVWVFRNANAPSADQFNKAWRYDVDWAGVETPRSGNWVRLVGRLEADSIVVEAIVAQSWARPMYSPPSGFKPWWGKRHKGPKPLRG